MIIVREFDMENDIKAVEEMERQCDAGPTASADSKKKKKENGMSICIDLLGDPMCRVRHAPNHVMLVAEYGEKEIVGVVRACVKILNSGMGPTGQLPSYIKVAYILGLRVSSSHRRLGIATKLVTTAESWCVRNGAEYSYIATDGSNSASLNLFTRRLSYAPFCSLSILTQPVHSHSLHIPSSISLIPLLPSLSSPLYETLFASAEFLPKDISSLLSHRLTIGTFLAIPSSCEFEFDPVRLPSSYAVMSLWNSSDTFRVRVSGATKTVRRIAGWARGLDRCLPWMKVPSLRDVFSRPFGVYLMYGLHMEGKGGEELMRCLCRFAHNLAREDEDCAAVVTEVAKGDPVRGAVPHWRRLSCEEDVWCMKKLCDDGGDDWSTKSMASSSDHVVFVDPREF